MFEVKKDTVKIKDSKGTEQVYEIGPLTNEYLEDFYTILNEMNKAKSDKEDVEGEEILKILGTDVSRKIHRVVYASLAASYPEVAKEPKKLEQFVTQNLFAFLGPVLAVNMPKQ
jgi:hypothetical protein